MKAVSAQVVGCCVYDKPKKITQHINGNIPNLLDFWTYPFVYIHLLKELHEFTKN